MRLRLVILVLGSLVVMPGCAGRSRPAKTPAGIEQHTLSGSVSFHADFVVGRKDAPPRHSLVPADLAPVPRLRVCAFAQRGGNDFAVSGHLRDDRKLACTHTDASGQYQLDLPRDLCRNDRSGAVRCDPKIYLATDLCAMHDGRAQSCVATNTQHHGRVHDVGWKKLDRDAKLMWTNTYRVDLEARTSNLIQWNLSCPHEDGIGRTKLRCERPSRGGYFDHRHSNAGYNRESVHAYWAGAMTVERFGDLVPRANTTLAPKRDYCGGSRTPGWKKRECTDAIRIVLTRMRKVGSEGRVCRGRRNEDHVTSRRAVCIGSPRNPWVVAHELGHALHLRWMNYKGNLNTRAKGRAVREANKTQTSEGWADFVAAAVLHPRDDLKPTFNGRDLGRATRASCPADRRAVAEISAAQFFWDLWDPEHASDRGDEVSLDLLSLLEIWSMFVGEDGKSNRDRTKGECDPHGRNLYDFRHYMLRHPDRPPDPAPLMREHCLDWQVRGKQCASR